MRPAAGISIFTHTILSDFPCKSEYAFHVKYIISLISDQVIRDLS
jgi:hypothetical protein